MTIRGTPCRSQSRPPKDLVARLEATAPEPTAEVLRDLDRALKRAGRPREKRSQAIDAAVVRLLAGSTGEDGLLEQLPLECHGQEHTGVLRIEDLSLDCEHMLDDGCCFVAFSGEEKDVGQHLLG